MPEIQVFRITLKGPELDEAVLQCIDDAVQFPLLFELEYQGKVRMVATYKRPSEADSARWVTSGVFFGATGNQLRANATRFPQRLIWAACTQLC